MSKRVSSLGGNSCACVRRTPSERGWFWRSLTAGPAPNHAASVVWRFNQQPFQGLEIARLVHVAKSECKYPVQAMIARKIHTEAGGWIDELVVPQVAAAQWLRAVSVGSPRVRFARSVFASVLISTTSSGSTPIPTSTPPGPSVGTYTDAKPRIDANRIAVWLTSQSSFQSDFGAHRSCSCRTPPKNCPRVPSASTACATNGVCDARLLGQCFWKKP